LRDKIRVKLDFWGEKEMWEWEEKSSEKSYKDTSSSSPAPTFQTLLKLIPMIRRYLI
jgi:hypothetical protein